MKKKNKVSNFILIAIATLISAVGCEKSKNNRLEGVASGGGGYSQRATSQVLELAKVNLATTIETSPDALFAEFPEEFSKKKLAEIIRKIEFRPKERRERDGSYLKLDYDAKNNSIFATYDFYVIYNVPSIFSADAQDLNKMVQDIQKDILHEISHLLGIGQTSDTDLTSQLFGFYFIMQLKGVSYVCDSNEFQLKYSPYSSTFLIRNKSKNQEDFIEDDDVAFLLEDHIESLDLVDDENFGNNSLDIIAEDYSEKIYGLLVKDRDNASIYELHDWLLKPSDQVSGAVLSYAQNEFSAIGKTISDYSHSEVSIEGSSLDFEGKQTIETTFSFTPNYQSANLVLSEKFHSEDPEINKIKNESASFIRLKFDDCVTKTKAFPLKLIQKTPIKSLNDKNIDVIEDAIWNY